MDIYYNPSLTVVFLLFSDYDDLYLSYNEELEVYYFPDDCREKFMGEDKYNEYVQQFNASNLIGVYEWSLMGLVRINVGKCDEVWKESRNKYNTIIHVLDRTEALVLEIPTAALLRYSKMVDYDYLFHGGLAYIPIIFGPLANYIPAHFTRTYEPIYGTIGDDYASVLFRSPKTDRILKVTLGIESTFPDDICDALAEFLEESSVIDYHAISAVGLQQKRIDGFYDLLVSCLE